jgi:ParB/RepB/Spo0J family partition protein
MSTDASSSKLKQIRIDEIRPNPDNPRIHFRQKEMNELLESIAIHGVQVPVSVYEERGSYVLIDGERRWRCCKKLNLVSIPALIQEKPDKLTNLLLMFNIHALREQWDLLTVALKLGLVIELLEKKLRRRPTESEVSRQTGLTRGVIRRCRLLLNLPVEFQGLLQDELRKPKREQKLTEDFFIEMERSLTTVERAMPDVMPDRNRVRRVLIGKFRADVIDNRTHFRDVAKIARASKVHASEERARTALGKLFQKNSYSIAQAYEYSVSGAYSERDILQRLTALLERLRGLRDSDIDAEVRAKLVELVKLAQRLINA